MARETFTEFLARRFGTTLKQLAESLSITLDIQDSVSYRGATDCSANPNFPAAEAGHLYVVSVAGKIGGASGVSVEAGDLFICKSDGSAAGTQAGVGANWDVIQTNVTYSLDTDGTLAANSDSKVASQKAVKTYADAVGTAAASDATTKANAAQAAAATDATTKANAAQAAAIAADPVKASAAEITTGTDDGKFATAKALKDAALPVNAQIGTSYTLLVSDNNKVITFNNGSAVTVTVPASLGAGFNCLCVQLGAGQVSFTGSGATVNNRQSHTKIAGQYGVATLVAYAANTFLLGGDTAA